MTNKKNTLPATVEQGENNQLALIFEQAKDAEFTEIQSGEFLEISEDEIMMLAFFGFETVRIEGEEKEAVIFYNREGKKLLDTHSVIVSKCKKIDISKGARIVTIEALGKVEGKKYLDFRVKVL